MYELFRRRHPSYEKPDLRYPQMDYLKRQIREQISDVKQYYRSHPKRVDSQNILGSILLHIAQRNDFDDQKYLRYVEDASSGVSRAFGITSPIFRGKVHEGGIILGPQTDEVMISTYEPVILKDFEKKWYTHTAIKYLYHTRTDLGLPVLNNTTPGKGYGVSVINIPLMALQYRYWLKFNSEYHEQKESVYRFIGMVVLPNIIDSFMDIAIFNRLSRIQGNIGISKFPTPHPFYLTDYSRIIDNFCGWILDTNERRIVSLERIVGETPMVVKETLFDIMQLPKDPVTRHNGWALILARIPYLKYLVKLATESDVGDRIYLNDILISIIEAERDGVLSSLGSSDVIKQGLLQLKELTRLIENK